ncbi:MAG: hypothetical protein R3D78_03995 [Paracoccaceae bacterium]
MSSSEAEQKTAPESARAATEAKSRETTASPSETKHGPTHPVRFTDWALI